LKSIFIGKNYRKKIYTLIVNIAVSAHFLNELLYNRSREILLYLYEIAIKGRCMNKYGITNLKGFIDKKLIVTYTGGHKFFL